MMKFSTIGATVFSMMSIGANAQENVQSDQNVKQTNQTNQQKTYDQTPVINRPNVNGPETIDTRGYATGLKAPFVSEPVGDHNGHLNGY